MASREVRKQLINDYRGAVERSPKWIRIAFSIFLRLPNKLVLNTPFLYFVLGQGTPAFKMEQNTADYGLSQVHGQSCGNCIYSYTNNVEEKNICSQIRGQIHGRMWCKLWSDKKE
jgi:hypothetical protein